MNEAVKVLVKRAKGKGWGELVEYWTATDESKEVHNLSSAVGCTLPYDIIYSGIRVYLEPRLACLEQLLLFGVEMTPPNQLSLALVHFLDLGFDTGHYFSDGLLHVVGGKHKWLQLVHSVMFECIQCDVWKKEESDGGNFADLSLVLPKRTVQTLLRSPNERLLLPVHYAFVKYLESKRIPDFEYLKDLLSVDHCAEIGSRALNFKFEGHELTLFKFVADIFEYNAHPTEDKLLALSAADRSEKFADILQLS